MKTADNDRDTGGFTEDMAQYAENYDKYLICCFQWKW